MSRIEGLAFIGELGLDGSVRPIRGVVPIVAAIENSDVVVPASTLVEANIAARGQVHPVRTLRELLATLCDGEPWPDHPPRGPDIAPLHVPDLCEVQGQPLARLALEIAAAGAHHSLFMGPPGSGKTMLASRLPGILPPLERAQALEATMVHSAAGAPLPPSGLIERPPFRAPHHTSSQVAIIGGGSQVARPGEVSLAHHGVLFLDEIAEFPASVLDSLRQPLEDGVVLPHRSQLRDPMPARFLLIAAMNPCPCGGGGARVTARAATRHSSATPDGSRVRCSIDSICASTCTDRRSTRSWRASRGSPRASWLPACSRRDARHSNARRA